MAQTIRRESLHDEKNKMDKNTQITSVGAVRSERRDLRPEKDHVRRKSVAGGWLLW